MDTFVDGNMSADQAKEEIKPWIRRFGRLGFMSKGLVYALVGCLAFMAAIGVGGGKTTGTSGMFRSLAHLPLGEALIWIIGLSLLGYISWSFIKAIKDPQHKGSDAKGLFLRFAYLVSAVIHAAIAYNAFTIAMKIGGGGNSEQAMTAKLLAQPFGQWMIGLLGAIIIGYGVSEIYQGLSGRFMKKFNTGDMDEHECKVAKTSGRMGLTSRGVVFGLMGFFFIQTAWTADPSKTKGIDGALSELTQQPFGQWLLGIAALGLFLYGVYQIARGRYQHMGFGK